MRAVTIEGTSIRVSRLTVGTASLHHVHTSAARQRVLAAAVAGGVTHVDTAPSYGLGLAETEVGKFLRARSAGLSVTTKVGLRTFFRGSRSGVATWGYKFFGKLVPPLTLPRADWSVGHAALSLSRSLRTLRRGHVDFLMLHEAALTDLDQDAVLEWLTREREGGRILAWGVAGSAVRCAAFVEADSPLAPVVQTEDAGADASSGDVMTWRRPPQFTFGYLRRHLESGRKGTITVAISGALARNRRGSVIVSARRESHWREILDAAAQAEPGT